MRRSICRNLLSCLLSVSVVSVGFPAVLAYAQESSAEDVTVLDGSAAESEIKAEEAIELGADAVAAEESESLEVIDDLPSETPPHAQSLKGVKAVSSQGSDDVLMAQSDSVSYNQTEARKLADMINDFRARNGLDRLTYDYALEEAAKRRAVEIAHNFSHEGYKNAIAAVGGNYTSTGENIVMHKSNATEAFNRWVGSPAHHDNMLSEYYNAMAIGFAKVNGETYWALELVWGKGGTMTGATRMPVGSKATFNCTKGYWIRLMKNGKVVYNDGIVSISGKTITAKKPGTTTIHLLDSSGREVSSKKLTVYKLNGSWEFQSSMDSNYVLDIKLASVKNAARMIVWRRNNRENQHYQFELMDDNSYLIKCVHSGKYLDVQYGGTAKQQAVIQWSRNAQDNQRWLLTVDPSNNVTFTCKKSGMCFDIQYGKMANGAPMIQWPGNGKANQKWVLNKK